MVLLVSSSASAELRESALCGTFPGRARLEVAKHRFFDERTDRGLGRPLRAGARLEIVGDLIVMNDDGTVIAEANPFDLHGRSLEFGRLGERAYRVRSGGDPLEAALGERVVIGDDQTRAFELSFAFPFFDRVYQRVHLNSDGNLTFDRGDRESTPRSLERFLTGPARIALFFSDL
ncbi:MAG TPA: hypothetical protein VEK15_08015, partial [Vicinamibacteria bacterium]|nr:hypothetical protein [Vicinamibacteria bacterium]